MKRFTWAVGVILAASGGSFCAEPVAREWKIDGVTRDGLVYIPPRAKESATPLIFDFHGHGGTAKHAARTHAFHKEWPEAMVVYLQGLNTPTKLVDPEGKKSGWQSRVGEQNNRDLLFFDAVIISLKNEYKVDDKRIYCTGHSNGGAFTYLLWGENNNTFAAVAPCAAVAIPKAFKLKPLPVLHLAGEKDTLVKFEWQTAGIEALRKLNETEGDGKPWPHSKLGKIYESKNGPPVVAYIHTGGHEYPKDAAELIVKFFKDHSKK